MTEELCIRFVNTVAWRLRDPPEERLPTSEALLAWLEGNGLCDRRNASDLRSRWRADARAESGLYTSALKLREAIYRILYSLIMDQRPPRPALALLNAWLARPSPGIQLAHVSGTLGWRLTTAAGALGDILQPISISAATLMTGPRARKIRQCSDDRGCGWLFVDESRAENRRWCAMGDCGNRAKAARHRARNRNPPVEED